jgi:serine/threonine protein phosphatase PrpC
MFSGLWNILKKHFGPMLSWEVATFSHVSIDAASARLLTEVLQPPQTIRLRPRPAREPLPEKAFLSWHGITDAGLLRAHNEDSLALLELGDDVLFIIADGMGGHDRGEVASRIAVETVERTMRQDRQENEDPLLLIRRAVQKTNCAVREEANRRKSNMGTTLTMALVRERRAHIASVGDSRAYWIRNGSIIRITKDHSLVEKLVETGKLTKEEARTDPRANLLLRSVGSDETVAVDTWQIDLSSGGTLLLCTDGLWGEVEDEDILKVCVEEQHTDVACARLVQLATARGGKDNISAIVAKVA